MSVSISAGTLALASGLSTYFLGIGGTAPYTYSVIGGGAGGTINSSGFYTAPSNVTQSEYDTIQVVDSLLSSAEVQILIGSPLDLFCDIIQTYMGLSQGQVYLWDQKINIPTDSRLYIAISILSCKPFGNSNKMDSNGNAVQSVNMQVRLGIDILSRGPDARDKKEQIILALQSPYAEQQQNFNSFYIGKISTDFVNISEIDGAAIPYRFNISVMMQYFVTNIAAAPYYNTFPTTQVVTNS